MAVYLDVSRAIALKDRLGPPRGHGGAGRSGAAIRAVFQSIYGNPDYVTDGIADLDAKGEISALNDRHRENAVNTLRVIAPERGEYRSVLDAAADAIEKGPVQDQPQVQVKEIAQEVPKPKAPAVRHKGRKAA